MLFLKCWPQLEVVRFRTALYTHVTLHQFNVLDLCEGVGVGRGGKVLIYYRDCTVHINGNNNNYYAKLVFIILRHRAAAVI